MRSGWSLGSLLGVLWAAALLVIVLFPKHNWAVGPSTNGQIHRVASIVAFLCLPVAVMLLTRRRRGPVPPRRRLIRSLRGPRSGWP